MRRLLGIGIVALLAACGGDGDEGSTTTTSEGRSTTTTEESAEEAFDRALRSQVQSDDDAFFRDALDAGQSVCETLTDIAAGIAKDDAENDSPGSDEAIAETSQTMALAGFLDNWDGDPAVAAALLRTAGEHLCPDHLTRIESLLQARDL